MHPNHLVGLWPTGPEVLVIAS